MPQRATNWPQRVWAHGVRFMERHFFVTTVVVILGSVAAVAWQLEELSHSLVRNAAVRDAASFSAAIKEFRALYSAEVIPGAQHAGAIVTHDYRQHPGAIPLPATMSKLLGERLGQSASHAQARLFSDYPFPWRPEGGPQDGFEIEAMRALRARPEEPFYRFANVGGRPHIRYARADRMSESCVQCHNQHPQSPKRDWKVGDVRGVLSVSMPLESTVGDTRRATRGTLLLLACVGGLIAAMFVFTITRLRKETLQARAAQLESAQKTAQLTSAKAALETKHLELRHRAIQLTNSRRAAFNLMQDMRDAKESAEQATLAKSQFLANMSHEIRTPMTAILGFAETLVENVTLPENVEAAQTIHRNGEHLLCVINDILDLSKVEAGKFQMESISCSPHELLSDIQDLMQVRADAKGLSWNVQLENALPRKIITDPTRLRQILINLVGNAIKFTEVGAVRLTARCQTTPTGHQLEFAIIDTGVGMDEEQQSCLFQPFAQADASMSRRFGGTGLGLTVSKRFATMLGGDIRVESQPGAGSTFTLTLSVGLLSGVEMCDSLAPSAAGDTEVIGSQDPLHGRRVLLVEDGPDNQRLIAFVLKKAGASVDIAENGLIGRDMALAAEDSAGDAYDVILMDMQMPVMDGYTAARELRTRGYEGPIIAVTAHAMSEDQGKCLEAGCDDFTTKPIDRRQLVEIVARHATVSTQQISPQGN